MNEKNYNKQISTRNMKPKKIPNVENIQKLTSTFLVKFNFLHSEASPREAPTRTSTHFNISFQPRTELIDRITFSLSNLSIKRYSRPN